MVEEFTLFDGAYATVIVLFVANKQQSMGGLLASPSRNRKSSNLPPKSKAVNTKRNGARRPRFPALIKTTD